MRNAVKAKAEEILKPTNDKLIDGAFELLDKMLPEQPLVQPVIENAEILFGVAA